MVCSLTIKMRSKGIVLLIAQAAFLERVLETASRMARTRIASLCTCYDLVGAELNNLEA